MILQTWQLVASVVVIFGFAWRIGYVMGESRAWDKMDRQEETSPALFHPIERIFGNVVYKTEGSTVLAVEIRHYGSGRDESYLLKTPNGHYFHQSHELFKGGSRYDYLFPYTKEEAMRSYNSATDKRVSFEEAFGEKLIEA